MMSDEQLVQALSEPGKLKAVNDAIAAGPRMVLGHGSTIVDTQHIDGHISVNVTSSDVFYVNKLVREIHADNVTAGWWSDPTTGESIVATRNVPEMLCLIHSEISEGMEGYRKNLKDDKLPHRDMLEVELADAVIRIFDLAGSRGYDLGGAIAEKRAFNRTREDHKLENRLKADGKKF